MMFIEPERYPLYGASMSTHLAAQPSPGLAEMLSVTELKPIMPTRIGAMMVERIICENTKINDSYTETSLVLVLVIY